jgi:hypothetical protein
MNPALKASSIKPQPDSDKHKRKHATGKMYFFIGYLFNKMLRCFINGIFQ